jgi:oligopeptidase B
MKNPPIPKKIKKILKAHGDKRIDWYYWLRDDKRKNKTILNYLSKENKYSDFWYKENNVNSNLIFKSYKKALPKIEESYKNHIDGYDYFSSISLSDEHQKYYQIYKKRKKLILDVNQLSKNKKYYSISGVQPSNDHSLLAFGEDQTGRREFSIVVKNIKTGNILEKNVCSASGGIIWNKSSDGYFYLKKDPNTLITNSLFFHKLGTNTKSDRQIYKETDNHFNLSFSKSRTKKYLFVQISKTESNEYRFLDLESKSLELKCFHKRSKGHLYYIDDTPESFFILSNRKNQKNFALYKTDKTKTKDKNWKIFIHHKKTELIENFICFEDFLILETRKNGLPQLIQIDKKTKHRSLIKFNDKAYSAYLTNNRDYKSKSFNFAFSSLKTPTIIYSQNLYTKKRKKIWQQNILNHREKDYEIKRLFIKARDGIKVPISLIFKKGINLEKAPLLQYGYGSYGSIIEPSFKLSFMPLINRGFVFAIAHIRGGQDLGQDWYDQGRMLKKMNTFTDFIDCTKGLMRKKIGNKKKTFAMGGSAGGLLMGAIINMEPELYKGIVSAVPFVDVLTTMSDESIPLTTFEYKEWGNPAKKREYFYIKKYSPYDNIDFKPYPSVLVTSSLYDSQVQYFEPAKYVSKLREYSTSGNPVLLKMNMIGGHAGKSGRLESLIETSEELSFLVNLSEQDD